MEILGLSSVPEAGETFVAMDTEKEARAFAETYISEGMNWILLLRQMYRVLWRL